VVADVLYPSGHDVAVGIPICPSDVYCAPIGSTFAALSAARIGRKPTVALACVIGRGASIATPFIVIAPFDAVGIASAIMAMSWILALLVVAILAFVGELRQRSLETVPGTRAAEIKDAVEQW
jgi:hypothetical protein